MSEGYRSGEDEARDKALAKYLEHAAAFDRIAKVPEDLREAINAARELAFVEGWRAGQEVMAIPSYPDMDVHREVVAGVERWRAAGGGAGVPPHVVDSPTTRTELPPENGGQPGHVRPNEIQGFTRPRSDGPRREANIGWLQPGEIGYTQPMALMELIDTDGTPQGKLWLDTRFPVRAARDPGFTLQVTRAAQHFLVAGPKEEHRLVRDEPPPRDSRIVMPAEWRTDQ